MIKFSKYQGAGNDFIMIDNRNSAYNLSSKEIKRICDRHFGIGADGLICIENDKNTDFRMVYYNSDGNESTMCGNGGRCIVQFAKELNIISNQTTFNAIDGLHYAEVLGLNIKLQMIDVEDIEESNSDFILNTGSPHYVIFVPSVDEISLVEEAKKIRYNERFSKEGINVNFVEIINDDELKVRTYERGVEDETLACGTGVTACALAIAHKTNIQNNHIKINVKGGNLAIDFTKEGNRFTEIFLTGPAEKVFSGEF